MRGHTVHKMDGEMMMGSSIYGVVIINGSLYSRFYGMKDRSFVLACARSSGVEFTELEIITR